MSPLRYICIVKTDTLLAYRDACHYCRNHNRLAYIRSETGRKYMGNIYCIHTFHIGDVRTWDNDRQRFVDHVAKRIRDVCHRYDIPADERPFHTCQFDA